MLKDLAGVLIDVSNQVYHGQMLKDKKKLRTGSEFMPGHGGGRML